MSTALPSYTSDITDRYSLSVDELLVESDSLTWATDPVITTEEDTRMNSLFDGLNLQSSGAAQDLTHWARPKQRANYEEAKPQLSTLGGFHPEDLVTTLGGNDSHSLDIATLLHKASAYPAHPSDVFIPNYNMFTNSLVRSHGHGVTPEDTLLSSPSSLYDAYPSPSSTMSPIGDYPMSEDGYSGSSSDYTGEGEYLRSPDTESPANRLPSSRRMARTRANGATGASSLSPYSTGSPQLEPPQSSSSRPLKRRFDIFDRDDVVSSYSFSEDGSTTDDGSDGFAPSSIGSDDEDIEPRRSSAPRNPRPSQARMPTKGKKAVPHQKKASGSKSKAASKTKLVLLDDEQSHNDGLLTCGLIVEKVGKGGRYTAKGMRTPAVGDICRMRCKSHEMARHQQTAAWHQNRLWSCPFCFKELAGREDNQKRHLNKCKENPDREEDKAGPRPKKRAKTAKYFK